MARKELSTLTQRDGALDGPMYASSMGQNYTLPTGLLVTVLSLTKVIWLVPLSHLLGFLQVDASPVCDQAFREGSTPYATISELPKTRLYATQSKNPIRKDKCKSIL